MAEHRERNLGIQRVRVADLEEAPWNFRLHPADQREALQGVVDELGWYGYPDAYVTPEGRYRLTDGHLRKELLLAKYGPDHMVEINVTDFTEEEARKATLSRDPLAAMAETSRPVLERLMAETRFGSPAAQRMLDALLADAGGTQAPEKPAGPDNFDSMPAAGPPRTAVGDLWAVGRHRMLVGDSTDPAAVRRLLGAVRPILMATDPPYGVDLAGAKYNPRAKQWDGIANDTLQGTDLTAFLGRFLAAWLPHMDPRAAFYFWTAAMGEGAAAYDAIRAAGLHVQAQIIWNKNCLVLGQADYHWKHENCWYAFWKGKHHRWLGERNKTTVWDVSKVANADYLHPMQKPTDLYAIPMRHHTYSGEPVAEPFLGSGTQLIAAEREGRVCYGMEIDPRYADVVLKRAEAEGLSAERVG